MIARISPRVLRGTVAAIPSKSEAHRALICAALADAPTEILMGAGSEDIAATIRCLTAFGARIHETEFGLHVEPIAEIPAACDADCGESGSTLRFLLPVAGALGIDARFHMRGRLPQRPIAPLDRELTRGGCELSRPEPDVLRIRGQLRPGDYELPGDVSSQYISGLLFALPILSGDSRLRVTGRRESVGYIEMTLQSLARFGVCPKQTDVLFEISSSQRYRSPGTARIGGDWSNAAFWLCADALPGCDVHVTGLDPNSAQGDRRIAVEIRALQQAAIPTSETKSTRRHEALSPLQISEAVKPGMDDQRTEIVSGSPMVDGVSTPIPAAESKVAMPGIGDQCTETVSGTPLVDGISTPIPAAESEAAMPGVGDQCTRIVSGSPLVDGTSTPIPVAESEAAMPGIGNQCTEIVSGTPLVDGISTPIPAAESETSMPGVGDQYTRIVSGSPMVDGTSTPIPAAESEAAMPGIGDQCTETMVDGISTPIPATESEAAMPGVGDQYTGKISGSPLDDTLTTMPAAKSTRQHEAASPVQAREAALPSAGGQCRQVNLVESLPIVSMDGTGAPIPAADGSVLDAADIPDLVPILAATACARGQALRVTNAGRLRIKESDRLASVSRALRNLGGDVQETEDGLIVSPTTPASVSSAPCPTCDADAYWTRDYDDLIEGNSSEVRFNGATPRACPLRGGEVDACGDHRIAMMAAIASCACAGEVTIRGAEAVNKSYPGFWRDFAALGGCVELRLD